jgi:hypothetical protein
LVGLLGSLDWRIRATVGRCPLRDDVGVAAVVSLGYEIEKKRRVPTAHEADEPNREHEQHGPGRRSDGQRPACATVPRSFTRALIAKMGFVLEVRRHGRTSIV